MQQLLRWLLCFTLLSTNAVWAQDKDKKEDKPAAPAATAAKAPQTREEAEKEFAELLTEATLVGFFTTDGDAGDKPLKPDRYELGAVRKVENDKEDRWLLTYKYKGAQLPLILPVKWAGNTPVLTLDELNIPSIGVFSARVMFHGDRYAGTWQHGPKGGLMFGRVERKAVPKKAEDKPAANSAK